MYQLVRLRMVDLGYKFLIIYEDREDIELVDKNAESFSVFLSVDLNKIVKPCIFEEYNNWKNTRIIQRTKGEKWNC